MDDVRFAARGLLKSPGFTLLVVLILALGIGANTATFTIVYSTLFRPLPYDESERLVMVWETSRESDRDTVTSANVFDWRARSESFEGLAAFDIYPVTLSGRGLAERFFAGAVTEDFFSVLRAGFALGRGFAPDEHEPDTSDVVVLSHGVWQSRFGGDPSILGQTIVLEGKVRTVIGVLDRAFHFAYRDASFWIPLALDAETRGDRKWHWIRVIARLAPEVSLEQARAEMDAVAAALTLEYPEWMTGWGVRVVGLREDVTRDSRRTLVLFMGAVGLVLLIVSANVANLLVARGARRSSEMAVRTVLGASRWRLTRQLLVESTMLASMGGAAGLALGWLGVVVVRRVLPFDLPRMEQVSLDGRVVVFTLALALVTGLAFGLVPARQAFRRRLLPSLVGGGRGSSGRRRPLQRALVVVEVAVSLVLLLGTALFFGSLLRLLQVDPGFDPKDKLAVLLILPLESYPDVDDQNAFFDRLMESMRKLPGVSAVESTTSPPTGPLAGRTQDVLVEGRPVPPPGEGQGGPHHRFVTPGYFRAMGIRLLRGRVFRREERDVLVVNETMARRIWPNEDPLGQRVRFEPGGRLREIIGIVSDTKGYQLDAPPRSAMYAPREDRLHAPISWACLVVATDGRGDVASLTTSVRERVREADPDLSIFTMSTLEEELSARLRDRRVALVVLAGFAAVALLLAAVGLFGVMAYDVVERTREIGLRMALGATRRNVSVLIVASGMRTVGAGLLAGAALSTLLGPLVRGMLFGLDATDPLSLLGMCAVLAATGLSASAIAARRAASISPAACMRHE